MNAAIAKNRLTRSGDALQENYQQGYGPVIGPTPCRRMAWHVIEADYKASHIAARSIADTGLDAYLPTRVIMQRKRRNGRELPPEPVFVPIFFQFLFARFDAANDRWPGRHTEGVKRVMLGMNQQPYRVPETQMDDIRTYAASVSKLPERRMSRIKPGVPVLIRSGLFDGKVGTAIKCNGFHTTVETRWDNGATVQVVLNRADVSDE